MKTHNYLFTELISDTISNNFNYLGYLPNPDKIINQNGNNFDVLRELRNDPHLWACIQSRKSGSMIYDYEINSNHITENIQTEIENLINFIDKESLYSDILDAIFFGFQPIEIVWNDKYNSNGLLYPKRFDALPQEHFVIDKNGDIFIKDNIHFGGKIKLPKHKILNIRHEYNYSNIYGTPLLSKCYWSVKFKNGGLKLWVAFMEKYGMPLIMGKVRRGASDAESQKLLDELSSMSEDAVIITPSDVEINLHEASRSSSADLYNDMIKYCNSEISKVILSQTLTTEINTGSYAASQTHNDIRKDVLKKDIRLIEKTINQIINIFLEVNAAKLNLKQKEYNGNIEIFKLKI